MAPQGDPAGRRLPADARRERHLRGTSSERREPSLRRSRASTGTRFTVSFKGVFLEGLEVAFIVVTFGGAQHNIGAGVIGAAAAASSCC